METDENGRVEGLLEQIQRKKAERAGLLPPRPRGGDLLAQVQRKTRERQEYLSVDAIAQQPARVQAGRPSSAAFWAAYLNYDDIPPAKNVEVWKRIGGSLGGKFGPVAENSCAARVSYGLNYGGAPIPGNAAGAWRNFKDRTYENKPGDDKYYIISVVRLNVYLTKAWGYPDYRQVATVVELEKIIGNLKDAQCAIFATRKSPGHSGVLKKGYTDPYVRAELPLDVWILPVP